MLIANSQQGDGRVGPRELWIVDDDKVWRDTLARGLDRCAPHACIRVFASFQEPTRLLLLRGSVPRGIILDERVEKASGVEWAAGLAARLLLTHIVLWTGYAEPEIVCAAYRANLFLVLKPIAYDPLPTFVHRSFGESSTPLNRAISRLDARTKLTSAQRRIVELTSVGLRRPEIAREMCISPLTVKHHTRQLLHVTGFVDMRELLTGLLSDIATGS